MENLSCLPKSYGEMVIAKMSRMGCLIDYEKFMYQIIFMSVVSKTKYYDILGLLYLVSPVAPFTNMV